MEFYIDLGLITCLFLLVICWFKPTQDNIFMWLGFGISVGVVIGLRDLLIGLI